VDLIFVQMLTFGIAVWWWAFFPDVLMAIS